MAISWQLRNYMAVRGSKRLIQVLRPAAKQAKRKKRVLTSKWGCCSWADRQKRKKGRLLQGRAAGMLLVSWQAKKKGGENGGPHSKITAFLAHFFSSFFSRGSYAPPEFFLGVLQHPQHPRLPRACLRGSYGTDLRERCDHRISKEEKCIAHVLEWMLLLI